MIIVRSQFAERRRPFTRSSTIESVATYWARNAWYSSRTRSSTSALRLSVVIALPARMSGASCHGRCGSSTCAKWNVGTDDRAARSIIPSATGTCDTAPPRSQPVTVLRFVSTRVSSGTVSSGATVVSLVSVSVTSDAPDASGPADASCVPNPPQPSSIGGSASRSRGGNNLWPSTTAVSRRNCAQSGPSAPVVGAMLFSRSSAVSEGPAGTVPPFAMSSLPDTDTVPHASRGQSAVAISCTSMERRPYINENTLLR